MFLLLLLLIVSACAVEQCNQESYYNAVKVIFWGPIIRCHLQDFDCDVLRVTCQRNNSREDWNCGTKTPWDKIYTYKLRCLEEFSDMEDPRMKEMYASILCEKPMNMVCLVEVNHAGNDVKDNVLFIVLTILIVLCAITICLFVFRSIQKSIMGGRSVIDDCLPTSLKPGKGTNKRN